MIKHEALLRVLAREAQPVVVGSSRGPVPMPIDPKCTVIIGTSGSTDYLSDATGGQRFWPVNVPQGESAPKDGQDVSQGESAPKDGQDVPQGESASKDDQACDGLHDEDAPAHYLCSRCFPDRGDLTEFEGEEYQHDAEKEMD
jgi:hypothetical protein